MANDHRPGPLRRPAMPVGGALDGMAAHRLGAGSHHGAEPKPDRYDGKASRTIPLFPELNPFLEDAFERAEPGRTHVVGGGHLTKTQGPNGLEELQPADIVREACEAGRA